MAWKANPLIMSNKKCTETKLEMLTQLHKWQRKNPITRSNFFFFVDVRSIHFRGIDLQHSCKEQDIEICPIKLNLTNLNIVILSTYRSPTGDLNYFLKELDATLNQLHICYIHRY